MDSKRAAEILREKLTWANAACFSDAVDLGAEALELLAWYEQNPRLVTHATGYCGSANGWVWRDQTNQMETHDAPSLIDALRAARKASNG